MLLKMPMTVILPNMCLYINYANDKVYPEDVKNSWVRLEQDTGPPIFIGLRDPVVTTLI